MNFHRLTYLVIDDVELMRTVTVNQLHALGCTNVETARDGAAALRVLRAQKVDVVLSDMNMQVLSGLELLRVIRADPKLARLPFLMITADAERHCIEEVIAAGASSLLVKPYSIGNLKARLEKIISDQQRPTPLPGAIGTLACRLQADDVSAGKSGTVLALSSTRILVVDDNLTSRTLLTHLFQDEYQVQTAVDGASALALCLADPLPDLILMDVMMPGMDGFEVVRRLREQAATAQIPVIFVTGLNDDKARIEGLALGAVDFVSKDTDPKMLRPRVRNFIKFIEMRRQLQADYDAMLDAARLREDAEHITRHDLKGSLAAIVGMVQSLANDNSTNAGQVNKLRLVEETALQVMGMVNLSTELYNIENGRFNLNAAPVELGHLLRRLVDLASSGFPDKLLTISFKTDTPEGGESPVASGDAMLCYSLFQNLLKNACEAAPPASRVLVTLKDDNPLRVLIQNTGAVPAALRDCFFDKFATSGKAGGSDLGTYSARLLATAQRGSVAMVTNEDEDSTILTITLPRHAAELVQSA